MNVHPVKATANVLLRALFRCPYVIGLTATSLVLGGCSGLGMETAHPVQLRVLNKSSGPVSFCFAGAFPKCEREIAPGSLGEGNIIVPKMMGRNETLRLLDQQALLICGLPVDVRLVRKVVPIAEIVKGERYQIEIYDTTQDYFCKGGTSS